MNKKGQFEVARKSMFWMIALFVITMVILGFAIMVADYKNKLTKAPTKLRAEMISLRFANIPECFAYQDPITQRVYPGIVDWEKFTEEGRIDQCYKTDEAKGFKSFNFALNLTGHQVITNNYFHYNKDKLTIFKDVLVRKNNQLTKDQMIIYVQEKIGS